MRIGIVFKDGEQLEYDVTAVKILTIDPVLIAANSTSEIIVMEKEEKNG